MAAPRFFFPAAITPDAVGQTIELPAAAAHHAVRVVRLAAGDGLTLFDGTGGEYAATLERVERNNVAVRIDSFDPVEHESPFSVTLAQAIAANDAMDYAVRKAVELGVTALQPLRHRTQRAAAVGRARRQAARALEGHRRRGMRAMRTQSNSARRGARAVERVARRMEGCRNRAGARCGKPARRVAAAHTSGRDRHRA